MKGSCKLCLNISDLKYSHIIPEYFYNPLYDLKHRFIHVSLEPDEKNKFVQKGIREYLLCHDCEQQLSKYERYANRVMYYDSPRKINQDFKIAIIEGIDYRLMKLFQLSILWRASVSSLPIFSIVKLGPHQERLRNMILEGNPGKYTDYGCVITAIYIEEKRLASDLVMAIGQVKFEGYQIHRFIFGGMFWSFFVTNHNETFRLKNQFLQENGILTLTKKPFHEIKLLMDYANDLYKQGKLPDENNSYFNNELII